MIRAYIVVAALAAAASAAVLAAPASGQTVRGVVVDHTTEQRLPGVELLLLDAQGNTRDRTLSDDSGAFFLQVPQPQSGAFVITGSLIGYGPLRSDSLPMQPGDELTVHVRMDVEAVPLEPLVIRARVNTMGPHLAGFYERMERGERTGFGSFISREEVDRLTPLQSTDLLRRVPGVRVVTARGGGSSGILMTGGCIPAIYVDGMQINRAPQRNASLDDFVPPLALEGIEIYRGSVSNQGSYYDPGGCGLILVWTRRGDDDGKPWSWRRFFAGAGLFAAILFLLR